MKEQTGETYQSSVWGKSLFVSEAKVGKSCFLIASALGALPWQKSGGIVDHPSNLHVLSFDSGALTGVPRFLVDTCGANRESLQFRVYNLQDDLIQAASSDTEYDYTLYNAVMVALQKIQERSKGTPVVIFSSLTGLAQGLERSIAGPPGEKRGNGMDQSKWQDFGRLINDIRSHGQLDKWHCLWEAHIYKPPATGQDGGARPETLQISGKSGANFGLNVEQIFRIRRMHNQPFQGTKCDQVFLDTRASLDFAPGGRLFTEALDAKEYDLTKAYLKLGLKVGGWGAKASPVKAVQSTK